MEEKTMVQELNLEETAFITTILQMADQIVKLPEHEDEEATRFFDDTELESVNKLYKKIEKNRRDTFYGGLPF